MTNHCAWGCGAVIANPANLRRHQEAHGRRIRRVVDAVTFTFQEAAEAFKSAAETMAWTFAEVQRSSDSVSESVSPDPAEEPDRAQDE